jgi:hypothetical protein
MATAPDLSKSTCALYQQGPSGLGKTMLAKGLAANYREGGPAEFEKISGPFNADMFRCPIILLDEGLHDMRDRKNSALVRSLVANTSHSRSEKFEPTIPVRGAVRLIIAANNDRVLAQLASEHDHSEDDVNAIALRFLRIRVQPEAGDYLSALNARDTSIIDRWCERGIAEHTLWLAQTRTVTSGKRFAVEGEFDDIHRALLTRGETATLILEWIARFAEVGTVVGVPGVAKIGSGRLYVNSKAISDETAWGKFCSPRMHPSKSQTTIGRVLKKLSASRVNFEGTNYYQINLDHVLQVADELQLNLDKIKANYER